MFPSGTFLANSPSGRNERRGLLSSVFPINITSDSDASAALPLGAGGDDGGGGGEMKAAAETVLLALRGDVMWFFDGEKVL